MGYTLRAKDRLDLSGRERKIFGQKVHVPPLQNQIVDLAIKRIAFPLTAVIVWAA